MMSSSEPSGSHQATPPIPKARHHFAAAVKLSPAAIKRDMAAVDGFNAKIAVLITGAVGTMWMAYTFTVVALISLPAILIQAGAIQKSSVPNFLTKPGLILIVAWVAQTLIQLVLLSIIMVGQDVQAKVSDARSLQEFDNTVAILDRLDETTEGGIKAILDRLDELQAKPRARRLSK